MDTFWQATLSGLVLLAVGGTAFLAWHDPKIFKKLAPVAVVSSALLAATLFIFAIGRQAGHHEAFMTTFSLNEGVVLNTPSLNYFAEIVPAGVALAVMVFVLGMWMLADARSKSLPASRARKAKATPSAPGNGK